MDDSLCIIQRAIFFLQNNIGKYFYVEEGSVSPKMIYLGNKVYKTTLESGIDAWSFSLSQYIYASISNVEKYLNE